MVSISSPLKRLRSIFLSPASRRTVSWIQPWTSAHRHVLWCTGSPSWIHSHQGRWSGPGTGKAQHKSFNRERSETLRLLCHNKSSSAGHGMGKRTQQHHCSSEIKTQSPCLLCGQQAKWGFNVSAMLVGKVLVCTNKEWIGKGKWQTEVTVYFSLQVLLPPPEFSLWYLWNVKHAWQQ